MAGTSALVRLGDRLPVRPEVTRTGRSLMQIQTAAKAFLHHLEHERQTSPLTRTGYEADIGQFLSFLDQTLAVEAVEGVKPKRARANDLAHFTPERIREWQAHLSLKRRHSPGTVRRKLHALASFAKFLVRTGTISRNPMAEVILPRVGTRVRQGMPLEVLDRVMALPLSPRESTMRAVLAEAGLRRQELIDLRVSDLRLGDVRPTLIVRGKGDKERVVPVSALLRESLLDYTLRKGRMGDEHVFLTDQLDPYHPSTINTIVKTWGRAVGWPALHPHKFRHTYATGLIASGTPLDAVQKWLGHASLATTQIYLHSSQSAEALAALEGWSNRIHSRSTINTPHAPQADPVTVQDDALNSPYA